MPRRVLLQQESFKLDLGDGDWVALKPHWTVFDKQVINDAMITIRWDTSSVIQKPRKGFRPGHDPQQLEPVIKMNQSMNMYAGQVAGLRRGIVAWGGPGFCIKEHEGGVGHQEGLNGCAAMALSDETIMALDDTTAALISKTLDELNPEAAPEGTQEGDGDNVTPLPLSAEGS